MKKADGHRSGSSIRILLILVLFAAFLTSGLVMVDSSFNSLTGKYSTQPDVKTLEKTVKEAGYTVSNWGSELAGACRDIFYIIMNIILNKLGAVSP